MYALRGGETKNRMKDCGIARETALFARVTDMCVYMCSCIGWLKGEDMCIVHF